MRSKPQDGGFADLFDQYVGDMDLPSTEWFTRLKLERPRRNTKCLGETTRLLKRATDVFIASILLVTLAPVMLLVAVAVRLTSRTGHLQANSRRIESAFKESGST